MRSRIVLLLVPFLLVGTRAADTVRFTDVTAPAGIHFSHNAGRVPGKKWLPETFMQVLAARSSR